MRLTLFSLIKHNQGSITLVSTVLKYKLSVYFQEDKGLKIEWHCLILTDSPPPQNPQMTDAIEKSTIFTHSIPPQDQRSSCPDVFFSSSLSLVSLCVLTSQWQMHFINTAEHNTGISDTLQNKFTVHWSQKASAEQLSKRHMIMPFFPL